MLEVTYISILDAVISTGVSNSQPKRECGTVVLMLRRSNARPAEHRNHSPALSLGCEFDTPVLITASVYTTNWPTIINVGRLRNDLYCVEWDVKLYYSIPYHHRRWCRIHCRRPVGPCNSTPPCRLSSDTSTGRPSLRCALYTSPLPDTHTHSTRSDIVIHSFIRFFNENTVIKQWFNNMQ